MMTKQVTTLAPWALAFIATFLIGWKVAGDPDDGTAGRTSEDQQPENRRMRPDRRERTESLSEQRMRSISGAGSSEDKVRAAIALANSLSPSEFSAWAEGDRFSYRSGPEMFIFRMILFERWLNEDQDGLIAWTGKNYYGQAYHAMQFLASERPEALIEHYRRHPDNTTELKNLALIAEKHPDLAIARLQELSLSGSSDELWRSTKDIFNKLAETSPGALEASLGSLPPELVIGAETALLGIKLKADFSKAIKGLADTPHGWEMFERSIYGSMELQNRMLGHLDDLPETWTTRISENYYQFIGHGNARQWLDADLTSKGFLENEVKRIRQAALSYAADSDPEYALSAIEGAGLSEDYKSRIISSAIGTAKNDRAKAEALIGLLSSEDDKALARANFETLQAESMKKSNPAEWLRTAVSAPSGSTNRYEVVATILQLEKTDPAALRQEFSDMSPLQKQNLATTVGENVQNGNVSAGFSGELIRYLVENTPEKEQNSRTREDPAFISSNYAVNLAMKDPSAATQWVSTLPDGETKAWAQKNLGKNLAQYDPKFVDQWLKTLPAGEQKAIQAYMGNHE